MIVTELYNGQGFGNQLWCYVVTRVLALDRGFEFGIMSPEKFKGHDFMDLSFGKKVAGGLGPEGGPPQSLPQGILHYYVEKEIWYKKFKCDIRDFDSEVLQIKDKTKIEGYFQSEKFISHHKAEIKEWLKIKPSADCYDFCQENICIMNIRGGEYKAHSELILPETYWRNAIKNMLQLNNNLEFIIITDDVEYANRLLPEFKAYHFDIGKDYAIIKNAKYLIISNSSFAFFPAWTSETVKYVIAPKYWARHNTSDGYWACAFNLYGGFHWQDQTGALFTYEECEVEYEKYKVQYGLAKFKGKPLLMKLSSRSQFVGRLLLAASRLKNKSKKIFLGDKLGSL
jgi:hypothetical protein